MEQTQKLLDQTKLGFQTLSVGNEYQQSALKFLKDWLTDSQFKSYQPQIIHIIENEFWDYLLDCFYQIIPFGTGGRRGEVGIGPNRINPWTITASAQGHSQYLIKEYGSQAQSRGVVLVYDVRQFFTNKFFSPDLPNPVRDLSCKDLARQAAEVYAANGIKVYLFDGVRTTPELSFAVRHLNAVSGDVFSASHNPPEHNGKKVYDEFGGQLIPPDDEALVKEVTENVAEIKTMDFDVAQSENLIEIIGDQVDQAYINACLKLSLSSARDLKIVYTPLHGCGSTSVFKVLQKLNFDITEDPKTKNQSGKFENVTFNIPNPEVIESFQTPLQYAKEIDADILLNSDPDADRIGIMVKHHQDWHYLNGNEIAAILTNYVISKRKESLNGQGIIIKTEVTTGLVSQIAKKQGLKIYEDLLVGFKYIGALMNQLENDGLIDNFLFGCEESHGYIAGNYVRDKDAVVAAIWLSELAAELKTQNQTLVDYLEQTYSQYGYFRNYLTEIRLPGAEGMSQIQKIQHQLRTNPPQNFDKFIIDHTEDWLNREPIVSNTDKASKQGLVFHFQPLEGTSIKITIRPSGTEPKIKMYFEIGSQPFDLNNYHHIKDEIEDIKNQLEIAFMDYCYHLVGVDFPKRGYLLFWQLPLKSKLHYFEIEPEIVALKEISDQHQRQDKLNNLLEFLGSDPIAKINTAFKAEYQQDLLDYLNL